MRDTYNKVIIGKMVEYLTGYLKVPNISNHKGPGSVKLIICHSPGR